MNNNTNGIELKVCSGCKRELPADLEHFHRHKMGKNGLNPRCKECKGSKFGIHIVNRVLKAKDGYKFCTICKKELPANVEHFYRYKDGFKPSCKVCDGAEKYGVRQPNSVYKTKNNHKICSICREEKHVSNFFVNNDNLDGYGSRCKPCEVNLKRKYHHIPEWQEKMYAYRKEYRKKYYATEHGKMINQKNTQKRKSRKANLLETLTLEDWQESLLFFNNQCAYCGNPEDTLHQEHVVPLSKGGHYTRQNIIPSCYRCNGSKHNHDLLDWYLNKPYFSQKRLNRIIKWTGLDLNNNTQQLALI